MTYESIIEFFKTKFKGDKTIWFLLFILSIISLIAVYSSIALIGMKGGENNTTTLLFKQALTLAFGIFITYFFHKRHYKIFYKLSTPLLIISAIFLLLTFSSTFAVDTNNATRWIQLPVIGFRFQPSELAKLALIIFVVKTLSIHQNELDNPKKVLYPILIVSGLIAGLILISNFSTAFLLMFTTMVILYLGRVPMMQLLKISGIAILIGIIMGGIILKAPTIFPRGVTWQKRIVSFMPSIGQYASGYDASQDLAAKIDNHQVNLAKMAIANGNILGQGPGNSEQKYHLSQAYCDFIYAIIIEDFGLFGGVLIVFLYLILLYRSGRIVRQCNYTFPALLVMALTFSLVSQAFIHMGVAVNLLPATGQTMPIISHGTSSLLTTSISFGIILSVSRTVTEDEDGEKEQKTKETKEEAAHE